VIAVGNLGEVWMDLSAAGREEFQRDFARFFGAAWGLVMVGAEKPFDMHSYWDGYFAVRDIKPVNGLTLADLAGPGQTVTRFNIVVG